MEQKPAQSGRILLQGAAMSFFKKLFGKSAGSGEETSAGPAASLEHNGFTILAEPFKAEGQFQLAGRIEKEIGGELRSHKFIRADRFSSLDDAVQFTLTKGQQIVMEQGDRMFD
jgi:hypothetical protein